VLDAKGTGAGLRVLHVVPSFWPAERYGGPIVSVRRLCEALVGQGLSVDVATTNADGPEDLDVDVSDWTALGTLRVRYFRRWPRLDYGFSPSLYRFLVRSAHEYDLFHITSTFSFPALAAGIAARRAGVPYVVSPRGNLQQWALNHRGWKKAPYWHLLERRHLERAARLHATAGQEAERLRQVLPGARVFIAPNGIDIPSFAPVPRLPRRLVFLGRIHRVKGFDVLIPALGELARTHPDVETVVAGPDDVGEWARVQARIQATSPRPNVRWIGAVEGEAKWQLLASARALVLPSHTENFGQAVVEALACRTPVVVSRNCPWQLVEERGAGAWFENRPEVLAAALRDMLDADVPRYEAMQGAAARLSADFTWPGVAETVARDYRMILEERQGGAP
jgi:glycosyltransferase involved in cell wall biosynthesis